MAIESLKLAQYIANLQRPSSTAPVAESVTPFEDLLNNAISQASGAESTAQMDMVRLSTGNIDTPHNITINSAKADLAVTMLVSVRNKALDAYNEIMRITL